MLKNSKPTRRTSRSQPITKPLPKTEARRLEHIYEASPSKKTVEWNPNRNDTYVSDVINVKSLLNIHSLHSERRQQNDRILENDRITINVCGDRYETHRTTLELFPDTLLGNHKRRKYYYDNLHQEYFFDRHRACFEAILYYYQSNGRLRRPDYVPLDIFLEEVTFFQLGEEALNQIRKDENIKEVKRIRLPKNHIKRFIWATMEYPDYSAMARIVNIISLLMVLVSILTLALESLPQFANLDNLFCQYNSTTNITNLDNTTTSNSSGGAFYDCAGYFTTPFFIIQAICVGFFTFEFLIRLLTTPSLLDFIKNVMNWIDILAIIPFFITLGVRLLGTPGGGSSDTYVGLRLLRILRLARAFKFIRVFKSVKSLRVLATTVRQSLVDFLIMIVILTLLGFLFGAATYYAENSANGEAFDSILKATYWGIITITSVGYGDIAPITPIGRILACFCALFGAATIGMLVSVLVDRYQRVYVRKLYYQEEAIDFSDYSDDENNDTEREPSTHSEHHSHPRIEDPDARAKEHTRNESVSSDGSPALFHTVLKEEQEEENHDDHVDNNSLGRNNNRVHFIVGYVDDNKNKSSRDLVEKINSVVTNQQAAGDNVSISVLSDDTIQEARPFDVHFDLDSSDDNDDDLKEIKNDRQSKGNLFKKFSRSFSQSDGQLNKSEKKA
ncbi:unnamed protein product [Adineta steineri]|uniref:BTB domain-containing protein n=1 Tax=Adineta steineri TaxID=433720 RepID=A0A814QCP5_9BILA|nr:unnamed protein product [Adineta steineri]